jgi:hypothetical protein
MVDSLYRDSLTEIADNLYKYHVIGNYFHLCSDKTIENNPIVNNELQQYLIMIYQGFSKIQIMFSHKTYHRPM